MSETLTLMQIGTGAEPIPGYVLEKRIGVGGYGEVWKATAPGGFTKAIKFIYGHVEDKRAMRELKSLNRVKELSHPFLLSLERIEIVDGHVMIVSELADSSLKDRFDHFAERGSTGIPREELIGYMREAADALDYLSDHHTLQHLDVKPENLLLVGGHIKVADFGLLKDLQDHGASLVHGLTPKYSAPEVFEGRPSRHSDQYSLAIVFQEMVSGQFPFDGRNAATIASQHLHCRPDLTALRPAERFAVGKALSKEPERRFGGCREFVERLAHQSSAQIITDVKTSDRAKGADPRRTRSTTERSHNAKGAANDVGGAAQRHDGQTIVVSSPEIRSLPAIRLDDEKVVYRPTVFIGVGGTGGRILSRLRQLLTDRFGDVTAIPALQMLFVDTDVASINAAGIAEGGGALRENETLVMPLRQTRDYRTRDLNGLKSISRRWIYNVPRSLRTEGLRALGRLALLDHSDRFLEHLRSALVAATDNESLAASSETTGLSFAETDPRVFIVASICGGTGSGAVLDIGYAARQVLAETGLSDEEVCGVLTYATSRDAKRRSLAPANAYACLDELRHFSEAHNDYPGETACGLAGFRESASTFKSTYFVDLGDDLSDDDFAEATDRLAQYLFLSSVSPASAFFDECHKQERQNPSDEPLRLRTLGLSPFRAEQREITSQWVEILCRSVVRGWRGGISAATNDDRIKLSDFDRLLEACDPTERRTKDVEPLVDQHLSQIGLNPDGLAQRIGKVIADQLGNDADSYLRRVIEDSINKSLAESGQPEAAVAQTLRTLDAIVGYENDLESHGGSQIDSLRDTVLPRARELGGELGNALRSWILGLVDVPHARVAGARQAVDHIAAHLTDVTENAFARLRSASDVLSQSTQQIADLCRDPKIRRSKGREIMLPCLLAHARLMIDKLICEAMCKVLATVEPLVTDSSDQLRALWKDLNQLSEEFQVPSGWDEAANKVSSGDEDAYISVRLIESYLERRWTMIEQVDELIDTKFSAGNQRLRDVLTQGSEVRTNLVAGMRAAARKVLLRTSKDIGLAYLKQALANRADAEAPLRQCLDAATPELLSAGGAKRLLLVLPDCLDAALLSKEVNRVSADEVSVARDPSADVVMCYDVEQLPLDAVLTRFVRRRPDCQDLASRLHTRIDIDWPTL